MADYVASPWPLPDATIGGVRPEAVATTAHEPTRGVTAADRWSARHQLSARIATAPRAAVHCPRTVGCQFAMPLLGA